VEPLAWRFPDGPARLVRWLVEEGQPYGAGALLAQARTADDRVLDLTADREGVLIEHVLPAGSMVTSTSVAATARYTTLLAGARLSRRHRLRSGGDWLLTADRRLVVECVERAAYVRVHDIDSGAAVAEVRPPYAQNPMHGGRACVGPDGRLVFVTWDGDGHFTVWDVLAGAALVRFKAPERPGLVLVDEARWRLVAEAGRRMRVGRYQRDTATVWDLRTGGLIEELVGEDLQRRYAGFTVRSTADAFDVEAVSPDGRLRALTASPGAAVCLREVATGLEVFRADGDASRHDGEVAESARVGFSADGRHLLAHWRCGDGGWVDVWDL
jgi:hypothetical protein